MNAPLNLSAIERAKLRLAEYKAREQAAKEEKQREVLGDRKLDVPALTQFGWSYDTSVEWNEQQMQGINAGLAGKSFCMIGAAGTGKTTTQKGIIYSIIKNNLVPLIRAGASTKWLAAGTPGIAMVSFTNMAVRQIAKHFSGDITCVTIHKLLEFAPVYYEVTSPTGETIKKMKFEPSRNKFNPLPRELKVIGVDEGSMVDIGLMQLLWDALPDPASVQFIYFGDLNQLPPVYGGPILGKMLLELPVIELTRVYRQALLSPIIRYALRMKDGLPTPVSQKIVEDNGEHGCVTIQPWSASLSWQDALIKAQNFCKAAIKTEALDVMQDIILCPYNVNFGVIELNLAIADYLGRQRGAQVHHIIAGFEERYLCVGDKVLVDKREGFIIKIQRNGAYIGKHPVNVNLYDVDRYGGVSKKKVPTNELAPNPVAMDEDFDVDAFLDNMQMDGGITERKNQSSHKITIGFLDVHDKDAFDPADPELETKELTSAGEVNEMLFGYAITVHKSQGSEWRRVFLLTHRSHAKMCSRELMYTAMTRAKDNLYIICEPDKVAISGTLSAAARKPRLKGNTLAEKLVSLKERFDREAKEAAKELMTKKVSDTVTKVITKEEADEE